MRKELKHNRIKPPSQIGLLAGFILLFFFNMVQAQEARVPKLSLVEHMFDFKEVVEGEIITHSFIIQNTGTDTLNILRVKPG